MLTNQTYIMLYVNFISICVKKFKMTTCSSFNYIVVYFTFFLFPGDSTFLWTIANNSVINNLVHISVSIPNYFIKTLNFCFLCLIFLNYFMCVYMNTYIYEHIYIRCLLGGDCWLGSLVRQSYWLFLAVR